MAADPGALAASLVQEHFPKFGTNRKECDYRQMGETTYNTATQTGTPVISQTHPGLFIIFANFNFTRKQESLKMFAMFYLSPLK